LKIQAESPAADGYSATATLRSTHRCRRTQKTRPMLTLKSLDVYA